MSTTGNWTLQMWKKSGSREARAAKQWKPNQSKRTWKGTLLWYSFDKNVIWVVAVLWVE